MKKVLLLLYRDFIKPFYHFKYLDLTVGNIHSAVKTRIGNKFIATTRKTDFIGFSVIYGRFSVIFGFRKTKSVSLRKTAVSVWFSVNRLNTPRIAVRYTAHNYRKRLPSRVLFPLIYINNLYYLGECLFRLHYVSSRCVPT